MDVFENFKNQLKANPKTIVFTEGTDARILSAASKLLAGKILNVLLLGNPEAVKKAAAEGGFDITGAEICDPTSYPEFDYGGNDGGRRQRQRPRVPYTHLCNR